MHHITVRESSCFSRRTKSTDAALGASLLLLWCNLKSTYGRNLARFYVLELQDVVPFEALNLLEKATEIAISRPITRIIGVTSLSASQFQFIITIVIFFVTFSQFLFFFYLFILFTQEMFCFLFYACTLRLLKYEL